MEEQPEALRLVNNRHNAHLITWQANACAELRRLYEVNQAMLDALKLARLVVNPSHAYGISIQSAIAKATGELK